MSDFKLDSKRKKEKKNYQNTPTTHLCTQRHILRNWWWNQHSFPHNIQTNMPSTHVHTYRYSIHTRQNQLQKRYATVECFFFASIFLLFLYILFALFALFFVLCLAIPLYFPVNVGEIVCGRPIVWRKHKEQSSQLPAKFR